MSAAGGLREKKKSHIDDKQVQKSKQLHINIIDPVTVWYKIWLDYWSLYKFRRVVL